MATTTEGLVEGQAEAPEETGSAGPRLYRLTVDQYMKMIEAGVFRRRDRVELLGGLLVEHMTKHTPHNFGVTSFAGGLRAMLPADWIVLEEKSLHLDRRSRPEPDIVIVRGPLDRYRRRDPALADLALVVEVADASYGYDRGRKWRRYASAGLPVYGILNIRGRRLEIYDEPATAGKVAEYRRSTTYGEDAEFPVVIEGREVDRVAVRDVLA